MPPNPIPPTNPRSQALLQATQHEADLLAGHLRQAAALGFASTSLRRLKRLQGLLEHALGDQE